MGATYRISGKGRSGVSWYDIVWNNGLPNLPTGFSGTWARSVPFRWITNAWMPLSKSASASQVISMV